MKAPDERGLTAQRLVDLRKRAGFTNQKAAAAHVREVTHVVGLTDSQWASYESGDPRRPFQAKHRAAIESVLGPLNDDNGTAPAPAPDMGALIAALTAQTAAMQAIVERFDAQQSRITALEQQLVKLGSDLRDSAEAHALSATPTPDGPGAPRQAEAGPRGRAKAGSAQ